VLYYRLHSFATAKQYLEEALAPGDLPPDSKARAEAFLRAIGDPESRSDFRGEIFAGARYQTNANFGPSSDMVLFDDFGEPVPGGFEEKDDINGFVSIFFTHDYDLDTPLDETWESNGLLYYSQPVEIGELATGYVDVDTGPGLAFLPHMVDDLALRPFLEFRSASFDNDLLYLAGGGGLELTKEFTDGSEATLSYLTRYKAYNATGERPYLDDQTGLEYETGLEGDIALTPDFFLLIDAGYLRDDADKDFESNDEYRAEGGFLVRYDAPGGISRWPWEFSVKGGVRFRDFDDPNPEVDPMVAREDTQYRVSGTQRFRLTEDLSVVMQGAYIKTDSNLPNYEYENITGSLAAALRF
jgi:hypothetical protein